MTRTSFRPTVDRLEDRETPSASPAELFAHLAQIRIDSAFMDALNRHPEYLVNRVYQPPTLGMLAIVAERQRAAAADIGEFVVALRANVAADPSLAPVLNPAIGQFAAAQFQALTNATVAQLDAQYIQDALGIRPRPVPPPSPPTPPTPPPIDLDSDSGMTDTLPNVIDPAFETRPNGLKVRDVQVGDGEAVENGASVSVYYTGWLTNGTVFDSRRSPNPPATFSTSGVIAGFREALIGMKPGGIRQVVIPPELGYGAAGTGNIPPNSTLIFEIKLITVDNP